MNTILAALGVNALVLAALAYLTKSLLGNLLQKDLVEFKNTLERKAAQEIEAYRAQLEKDRLRLQISYGGIFEKQADAILALHEAILSFEATASRTIHVGGDARQRKDEFVRAWRDLLQVHERKRILLPPAVDDAISAFMDQMFKSVHGYMSVEARDFSRIPQEQLERLFEKQDKALDVLMKEVPVLRGKLIAEMRKVIGIVASEF